MIQRELLGKAAGWVTQLRKAVLLTVWLEADEEGLVCPFLGRTEVTMPSSRGMVTPS